MVVQACKLNLPLSSLSSPHITSLLFEPHSLSLALMHSDSSFSLLPSLSPFSLSSSSPPPPQTLTLIPPPSSSSSFLLLHPNPNPNPNPNSSSTSPNSRVLFVVAAPHNGGASVLLRFYILRKTTQVFVKAQVLCSQKDLRFDDRLGVIVNVSHGVSVKLAASINVLAMYSFTNSKIWVFAAKMAGDNDDDGVAVKLMKCAVIECSVPVWSISVSFGYLILGEDNGVRVFALRPLVKGRVGKCRRENKNLNGRLGNEKLEDRILNLPNGMIRALNKSDDMCSDSAMYFKYEVSDRGRESIVGLEGTVTETCTNGYSEGKIFNTHCASVKLRSTKLRQDSGACFMAFKSKEIECSKSTTIPLMLAKAISIHALSPNKFLILDSLGDLHLLRLSNPVLGSKIICHMRQLTHVMNAQKLAILPDFSTRMQTVWISDGFHSVHMMGVSDMDSSTEENDRNESDEKLMQISVIQAIFASEKIQDIVPLAANAILILGQGSIFAYAIS